MLFSHERSQGFNQVENWQTTVCSYVINSNLIVNNHEGFTGSFFHSDIGGLKIFSHSSNMSLIWKRTKKCINGDRNRDLYLGLICEGVGFFYQHKESFYVSAGDLVLCDASIPFDFSTKNISLKIIQLPREGVDKHLAYVSPLMSRKLNLGRPRFSLLAQAVDELFYLNDSNTTPFLMEQFVDGILNLIFLSINIQNYKNKFKPDLYSRILVFVRKNYYDHELSVAKIAKIHHVSPRTVSRVFATHGITPMSLVWQERLLASYKVLISGNAKNVTQVAIEHGFKNLSHFSFAFRKKFGLSPAVLLNLHKKN